MAKLSEQLADLSAHAKHAEDAVSAAQKEARDKILARREQARAAATAAAEKVNRDIKSAGDNVKSAGDAAAKKWTAFQTKISNDLQSIKEGILRRSMSLTYGMRKATPITSSGKPGSPSTMPLPLSNKRNWRCLMLWPAGWKLQKLGGHSCAAFESKIEVLKSWPSGGWSDHASAPKPLILQEFKQIARGIACVRHPTDKR